ncbi:uroporphyrinogen decarboxylase [Mesorhizobium mediterraneum]|uniref:Uroporphyrinogen decarboxylase n=1 Tax=Mesorhizobium mediterraneum TaxID=43617 RepID=A0AB36RC37_9HYPH|nr:MULTISPECIES: uroporphyrinogen decarboxylase [Mesorhizobium]PAQ02166.1 uroporphyrinogen decarboxylase [Mesorhizobium mediterraneum]RUU38111.1 uroporphyrinogen decarboxylase [Mesorhizobium sp. M6A.T.Ce.TU.002.03.1.1]RUV00970.1 uroporphyrinogen decarboxylase [Mesorhizobium sp. M6A.T.Cr.TU.017.01.1.1]RWN44150.1 MAG: uroporphyrinogen decarboxylase [Mesorhizobium sp.]RWO97453.1 MAG: uroporphyrinogen decarboxylase [Mesorhizobium sp.]
MPENRIMRDVLKGEAVFPPPLWMMRQAGRYLPEYRETRRRAGSFLDLCYNPDFAVEVTLQPIERFGFDASILFSDILVVPHALGRDVRFEEGRGPLLTPISATGIAALDGETFHVNLEPVYETVRRLRAKLPDETTLIGFCGAPWTVATYMIAGHGTSDQAPARLFAYREPAAFLQLLNVLADHSAAYLIRQIEAGADVVQIFDSWSGVLDEVSFEAFCIKPVAEIVRQVRAVHPDVPIIGFPKGAGAHYRSYRQKTGVTGLGLDWTVPLTAARELQRDGAVQGNLDPLRLVAGGKALADGVDAILKALRDGPLIFNLGHGITPETPIAHVEAMVKMVRSAS